MVTPEDPLTCLILRAKLALPFAVISDPGGSRLMRSLGVWDEPRGAPLPAMATVEAGGLVSHLAVWSDDRSHQGVSALLDIARRGAAITGRDCGARPAEAATA